MPPTLLTTRPPEAASPWTATTSTRTRAARTGTITRTWVVGSCARSARTGRGTARRCCQDGGCAAAATLAAWMLEVELARAAVAVAAAQFIRAYAITPMKRLPNFCTRAGRQLIADDTLTRAFLGRAADLNVGAGERMFNSALGLLAFGVKVYLLLAFFRELKEVRFSGLELIKAVWPRSTA